MLRDVRKVRLVGKIGQEVREMSHLQTSFSSQIEHYESVSQS